MATRRQGGTSKSHMTYFERVRAARASLLISSKHSRPGDAAGPHRNPVGTLQSSAWATSPHETQTHVLDPATRSWAKVASLPSEPASTPKLASFSFTRPPSDGTADDPLHQLPTPCASVGEALYNWINVVLICFSRPCHLTRSDLSAIHLPNVSLLQALCQSTNAPRQQSPKEAIRRLRAKFLPPRRLDS